MFARQAFRATAAVLLALSATACSESATGPSGDGGGSAQAVMHDDPSSGSGALAPSFSRAFAATSGEADYSGSMQADVKVQVSADGSTWVDVNDRASSASRVEFRSGSETTVAASSSVQAGSYSRVRVIMENAGATVNSGSSFSGGGLVLSADVSLDLGSGGRVVIEKRVSTFEVRAGSTTTIEVDVNSEAWMSQENVEARAVSSSEIESAAAVSVR